MGGGCIGYQARRHSGGVWQLRLATIVPVVFTTKRSFWALKTIGHTQHHISSYDLSCSQELHNRDKKTSPKNQVSSKVNNKKTKNARAKRRMLQQPNYGLARMIADPCNAPLHEGQYGGNEGYISRFKAVTGINDVNTNGYILWNPYAISGAGASDVASGFYFINASSSVAPLNTVANPWGTVSPTTTGNAFLASAGDAFAQSATCQTARTLAACSRVVYVGTTSNTQGRIAYLENIDPSFLLNLPTVDNMFQIATKVERVGLDPMEVTYRPSEIYDAQFKRDATGSIIRGTPASVASNLTQQGVELQPKWMGFAWSGVPTNQLIFENIRILEWKPELGVGLSNNNQSNTYGSGEPIVNKVLAFLDRNAPGWTTTLMHATSSTAAALARIALGGQGQPMAPLNVMGRATPLRVMY